MAKESDSILVFDAVPVAKSGGSSGMMGPASVPVEAMQANLQVLLGQCRTIFADASKALGTVKLAHVDLTLSIGVDGSVGLIGSKLGAEAKGGVTVRLLFQDSQ